MDQSFETLKIQPLDGDILQVWLDRPDASNAMNTQMGRDLLALFGDLGADPQLARSVILSATGTRAFCAGADLKERKGMTDETWMAQHLIFEQMIRAIIDCPVPVIAAVNGAAYGGGCEIALGCDFIYASRTARFALTEVTLGIMPGCGGTQNLPRSVGERRAKELIMSGTAFTAEEAMQWGMVNRVCEPEALMSDALAIAQKIAANGPIAVRQAKHAIHYGLDMSVANGMQLEIQAYNRLPPTNDRREGILAFNEKRRPVFRGM
ncbi:MAG TPA: enoyl-CoA hydratase-related protein [Xanthobacteraceae bacterium]